MIEDDIIENKLHYIRKELIPECKEKLEYNLSFIAKSDNVLEKDWNKLFWTRICSDTRSNLCKGIGGSIYEIKRDTKGNIFVSIDYYEYHTEEEKLENIEIPLLLSILKFNIIENSK